LKHPRVNGRVSMKQVADRAGVALSSVSRVLSGHPDVSAVMRNRVIDAVAALGYEPDLLAQSLRRGASMTVGFVVGNIANPLFAEIALGAEIALRASGYTMLLANSMGDADLDRSHVRLLAQRRVDGLLLSPTDEVSIAPELERADIPGVMVDRVTTAVPSMSAVLTDHDAGIREAVDLLATLGHRRIALVNGNLDVRPGRERAASLRRACRRHPDMSAIVRSGPFTSEHGFASTSGLLNEPAPPTAIIAGSNQILVGVLGALGECGARVPGDVSLVTCDEVPLAGFLQPPLATIWRDPQEMGAKAGELLLARLAGGEPETVTLPAYFRATESCAAPSSRSRRR